jgi:hypothetical protein
MYVWSLILIRIQAFWFQNRLIVFTSFSINFLTDITSIVPPFARYDEGGFINRRGFVGMGLFNSAACSLRKVEDEIIHQRLLNNDVTRFLITHPISLLDILKVSRQRGYPSSLKPICHLKAILRYL